MFRFETDMLPVLKAGLSKLYRTQYFVPEFKTGLGVVDLVFTRQLNKHPLVFRDYKLLALFLRIVDGNKQVSEQLVRELCGDTRTARALIDALERGGFIDRFEDKIVCRRKYKPHTAPLTSIEMKLKDWKAGLYQALRHQNFSHKCFLAYPEHYLHRVDLDLMNSLNVGLISVGVNSINLVLDPRSCEPKDLVSYFYLSETFAIKFESSDL